MLDLLFQELQLLLIALLTILAGDIVLRKSDSNRGTEDIWLRDVAMEHPYFPFTCCIVLFIQNLTRNLHVVSCHFPIQRCLLGHLLPPINGFCVFSACCVATGM